MSAFLTFLILAPGCSTIQFTERETEFRLNGFDFREYTEKGFLFMPGEYYDQYEVLGIITIEMHPKVVYMKGKVGPGDDYYVQRVYAETTYSKLVQVLNAEDLVREAYHLAVEWGGDGLMHFDAATHTGYTDLGNNNSSYAYWALSGVVIKRK